MTPEVILEQLLELLRDGTVVIYAVPLIVLLVNLVKRLPFLADVSAAIIHLVLQVAFWVLYTVAGHYGGGEQLQTLVEAVTPFLEALLPLFISLLGGHAAYQAALARNIPVFGYQRTDQAALREGKAPPPAEAY